MALLSLPRDVLRRCLSFLTPGMLFMLIDLPSRSQLTLYEEELAFTSSVSKSWRSVAQQELETRYRTFIVLFYERVRCVRSSLFRGTDVPEFRWYGHESDESKCPHFVRAFTREQVAKHVIAHWRTLWATDLGFASRLAEEEDPHAARGVRPPGHYRDPIRRIYNRMDKLQVRRAGCGRHCTLILSVPDDLPQAHRTIGSSSAPL